MVRETTEDFRRSLENNLRLDLELPDRPLWVIGDRTRLAQVLSNLLHNASKFSEPDVTITVKLESQLNDQAVLTVRDTGIGIEPEMLSSIVDRLTRRTEAWTAAEADSDSVWPSSKHWSSFTMVK